MTRMRSGMRVCGGLVSLLAVGVVATAQAQDGNVKIGVVNLSRLIEQSPQAQAITAALRDEFAPRQRDLQAMDTALKTKQETYQRDVPVMGEAERARLEREITAAQRELQRADQELREDLNIRQNEEIAGLNRLIVTQVQTYARSQGYDLVLYEAVYASEAVDITAAVLASLQATGAQGAR
jgi:outer membrane protein